MIIGIGVDVTRIERFKNRTLDSSFCSRVYGKEELAWLEQRGQSRRTQGLAAAWAAKEAFLKAAGTGLAGFALQDIQLMHGESGAPYLQFREKAQAWMKSRQALAHVSVSHDAGICTAFVVLEVQNKEKDT